MVGWKIDLCIVRDLLICLIYYLFDLPYLCIENIKCLSRKITKDNRDERDERDERDGRMLEQVIEMTGRLWN